MPIITNELIESLKTPNGAWTRATLSALDISWPPLNGWKHRIIGQQISDENLDGAKAGMTAFTNKKKRREAQSPQPKMFEAIPETLIENKVEGVLHFDGSCWPNPGPNSKCGFILRIKGIATERSIHLGEGTNNTAEYNGLIHGLRAAIEAGITHLEVYGDSQIVINGVKRGPWKGGKPHLELLKSEAITLAKQIHHVDFNWVPREENTEADALSIREIL